MATKVWAGTTGTWSTAGNWSPSGAPTTGDDVVIDGRNSQAIDGSDQSAVTLNSLTIYRSRTANVGSASTPLKIKSTTVSINADPADGSNSDGPSVVCLDLSTAQAAVTVYHTRNVGSSGLPPVMVVGTHASNTLHVVSGIVGVGVATPGEAATFATVTAIAGTINVGTNVTLTTVNNRGAAILTGSSIPTLNGYGGFVTTTGTAVVSTAATLYAGATLTANGRPAVGAVIVATLNLRGGTLDLGQDARAATVTTLSDGGGTIRLSDPAQLTVTTLSYYWGTASGRQVTMG